MKYIFFGTFFYRDEGEKMGENINKEREKKEKKTQNPQPTHNYNSKRGDGRGPNEVTKRKTK